MPGSQEPFLQSLNLQIRVAHKRHSHLKFLASEQVDLMGKPYTTVRRVLLLSLGVSILSSAIAPASALSVLGKKSSSSFDLPCAEKLDGDTAGDAKQDLPDLAPMKLSDTKTDEKTGTAGATGEPAPSEDGTLNASVTENTYVPKGPLEGDNAGLLAPTSMKGSKTKDISDLGKGSVADQAKAVNLAPVPLLESMEESARKADNADEIEREQLTGLWEASLARNPNINFVLQKLMPSSDPSKTTTVMMRMLALAMNGGLAASQMMMPTPGMYAATGGASNVLGQLMGMVESKQAQKAKLTQADQINMFKMIREEADKLVDLYRDYKIKHKSLYKANADFEDLKSLATGAKRDGAKEFEIQYTLRRQQRDIEEIGNQLASKRRSLCDMAGRDAVEKLDASIDDEFKLLHPELAPTIATPGSTEPLPVVSPEEEKPEDLQGAVAEEPSPNSDSSDSHKVAEKVNKGKPSAKLPSLKLPI